MIGHTGVLMAINTVMVILFLTIHLVFLIVVILMSSKILNFIRIYTNFGSSLLNEECNFHNSLSYT